MSKTTYRVWWRLDGGIWERLSGGVMQTREDAVQWACRDRVRRERYGNPTLQYAVQESTKTVGPKEIV